MTIEMAPGLASSADQMQRIIAAVRGFMRLPFVSGSVPGGYVEAVVAQSREGKVLNTYDFVDVISELELVGWQVKSTKITTPVTWKRAKIPFQQKLINASQMGDVVALKELGDSIITFCNDHAKASLEDYGLDAIGYARVIINPETIVYFERELITKSRPILFDKDQFEWQWTTAKRTFKKEQLPALHGTELATGKKWFAWHGLGENQLHFSGEKYWHPLPASIHRIEVDVPSEGSQITFDEFATWLAEK